MLSSLANLWKRNARRPGEVDPARSHLDLFLGGFRAVGFLAGHDAVEVLRFAQQDLDLEPMQEHVFRNDPICYTQTETKGVHNKECDQMKNKLGKIMSPWLYGQADP